MVGAVDAIDGHSAQVSLALRKQSQIATIETRKETPAEMRAGPLTLNRDDCRRTLRRLELEAYASMVSVLRAQGHLREERRRLLEAVRSALHIGSDRHQAEARRVSNDELLAAIAEQLCGPNTGLDWAREGRRKIPIMPRGVPQTLYTAIADKAAIKASEENDLIAQRVNAEQHVIALASPNSAIESTEEDIQSNEVSNVDLKPSFKDKNESNVNYPPIVTCDQSLKVLNDDGPPRKRSRPDCATNVPHRTTHQKHLDLAPIYTCYSKPHSGKAPNQYGRSLYNPSGKMSNKSNHSNLSKSNLSKHRSMQNKHGSGTKHCGQVTIPHHQVRSGIKSPTDPHIAGSQALCIQNQVDGHIMKSQTPAFQANYAQPIVQNVGADESSADIKLNIGNTILESPTMQLLTQTPTSQAALVSSPSHTDETLMIATSTQNLSTTSVHTSTPKVQQGSGKACHFIIKKKSDNTNDNQQTGQKIQVTNKQIISKQDIKVLQNRQVVISPSNNNSQKILNSSGKLITTKIVQHIPQKSQAQMNVNILPQPVMDKLIIMPKQPTSLQSGNIQRSISNTTYKNLFISTHSAVISPIMNPIMTPVMIPVMNTVMTPVMNTVMTPIMNTVMSPIINTVISPVMNPMQNNEASNLGFKVSDADATKNVVLSTADLKLHTKTFLFNSKSGKKMVVLPAKQTSVMGPSVPLLMKGVAGKPTAMKLLPVSGQSMNSPSKSNNITVVSKTTSINTPGKNVTKDTVTPLKVNSSNDSPMPKVLKNISIAPRPTVQSIKQSSANKGNIIVVQKSNTMSKNPITFAKSGIDTHKQHISNILLGDSIQVSVTPDMPEISLEEPSSQGELSSAIVSELNIEQTERPSTEEFMDEGGDESMTQSSTEIKSDQSMITEETANLFPNQVTEEECNADSMESTVDSLLESSHIEDPLKSNDSFSEEQDILKLTQADSKILLDQDANLQNFSNWEVELPDKQNTSDKTDEINLELEMSTDSEVDDFGVPSDERTKQNKEILHEDGSQDIEQDDTNEMFVQHSSINQARRALLSQLQDDGSSSNDSPFVLTKNLEAARLELLETSQTSSSAME